MTGWYESVELPIRRMKHGFCKWTRSQISRKWEVSHTVVVYVVWWQWGLVRRQTGQIQVHIELKATIFYPTFDRIGLNHAGFGAGRVPMGLIVPHEAICLGHTRLTVDEWQAAFAFVQHASVELGRCFNRFHVRLVRPVVCVSNVLDYPV